MSKEKQSLADEQTRPEGLPALVVLLLVTTAVMYLAWRNPEFLSNVVLMLLGFGAVIFVHELGHFLAAKLVDIEVESFSIGINPILFGLKRQEGGFRVRLLPGLLPGVDGKSYSPADYADARILIVVFSCNHCPTSSARKTA